FLKEKDKNLDGGDLREGLTAVISVRVPEALLQFEGQTKGRLGTPEVRSAVDKIVAEKLSFFLQENSKIANNLVTKALKAKSAREAAQKHEKKQEVGRNENERIHY